MVDCLNHHSVVDLDNFVGEESEEIFLIEGLMMGQCLNNFGKIVGVFWEVEVLDEIGGELIMLGVVGVDGIGDIVM